MMTIIVVPIIVIRWSQWDWQKKTSKCTTMGVATPLSGPSSTVCLIGWTSSPFDIYLYQGTTDRGFQLRDGLGSGIEKNFGFGYGSGSGIGTTLFSIGYYRVLKILIGYFLFTSVIRYFFGFNYGSCSLWPMTSSACLIGTTNVLKLPACKCLYFADLYRCWSVINVFMRREDVCLISVQWSVSRNAVPWEVFPNTFPREQGVYWIIWSLNIVLFNIIPVASEYQELHPISVVNIS